MSILSRPFWSQLLGSAEQGRSVLGLGTAAVHDAGDFDPAGAAAAVANSLKLVATTGKYSDLSGKPTLGALSALDDLPSTKITGTISDAQLSANVALKNATNTFTAVQTINLGSANGTLVTAQEYWGQSSMYPRRQAAIRSAWANSTEATRLGRWSVAVDGVGALQDAIKIDAGSDGIPTITNNGMFVLQSATGPNRDWYSQFKINDGTVNRLTFSYDAGATRLTLTSPNGLKAVKLEQSDTSFAFTMTGALYLGVTAGFNTGFFFSNGSEFFSDGSTVYIRGGGNSVRFNINGVAGQTANLTNFADNTGTVLLGITAGGRLKFNTDDAAPANTATIVKWITVNVGGTNYKMPLYL